MIKTDCEGSLKGPNKEQNRTEAVMTRCRRSPMPGQPFGNVENRRCKNSLPQLRDSHQAQNPQMKVSTSSFRRELKLDNSSQHRTLKGWSYYDMLSLEIQFKCNLHQTRIPGKGCDSAKS